MCRQQDVHLSPAPVKRVIISGAGPAGLLLTALLMQRNQEQNETCYNITLVDGRLDLGKLSQEELKESHRSWMLGLANHGLEALKTCNGLYEEYAKDVGILLEELSIHIGKKEIKNKASTPSSGGAVEGFIIDRNFMVAALARFVNDHKKDEDVTTLYDTKIMYVDYENKRALIRNNNTQEEEYVPYDLLVGCDGIRSVVREALVKRHPTFELEVKDIFQSFKSVHVALPKGVSAASMHLLPGCLEHMMGIGLPETGNMINISIGVPRSDFDKLPSALKSDNPEEVAEYFRKNFVPFELVDYDDLARQWVGQRWNRTGQVHCNFYHSNECGIVIMGDAAHATSPSIGMGMNTALRDAQFFYSLLQEQKDNLADVLPKFSELRVKDGNALSDLAMHLYCLDTKAQLKETIHLVVRSKLNMMFPSLVTPHPQAIIGMTKYTLAQVYQHAHSLGIIQKHRRINDEVRQAFFERETGMIDEKNPMFQKYRTNYLKVLAIGAVVVAGVIAYAVKSRI